jgi:predicted aldo/keto reductase-like oxidoreductase
MRDKIFIATKTTALTVENFEKDLETSLRELKCDYIDIYQFHNPGFCPKPGDESGIYEAALRAKEQGKIRHIGITNHRLNVATEAIESGLYETMQFPFSYLSSEKDLQIAQKCKEADMGFVAMKALAGGLITDSLMAAAFMGQYDNVLPIWGVQKMEELEEWLAFIDRLPEMTDELRERIEADRAQFGGEFCRGCGYCMPCPAGIEINMCARMSLLLRRSPSAGWLNDEWQEKMERIDGCMHCDACKGKCPYGLDTPTLLQKTLEDYRNVVAGNVKV